MSRFARLATHSVVVALCSAAVLAHGKQFRLKVFGSRTSADQTVPQVTPMLWVRSAIWRGFASPAPVYDGYQTLPAITSQPIAAPG
ncbi:hypothetical protein [Stutzerimonas stutzeri]|uniref:hypothetical protein n=1 Tax=Stutzerimonas stutzeri TaxID=316 RepID=UPI0015E2F404|nr:hypothetical protein [Stutzerimonas stutzeri]MBA1276517.1 hypothetical protein [Stutzerimonas stutzeri]